MLRFIVTKIKNKYKLYLALMVGVISMIAGFGVVMMLRKGSLDRLIQSEFRESYEKEGTYPAVITRTSMMDPTGSEHAAEDALSELEGYESTWDKYLKLPVVNTQRILWMKGRRLAFSYRGEDGFLDFGYMDTDYNGEHFRILDGSAPAEAKDLPEGVIPVMIDRHLMDVKHFAVGETLTQNSMDGDATLTFRIVGIFEEAGTGDYFWQRSLEENGLMIWLTKDDFSRVVRQLETKELQCETRRLYDYRKITVDNASAVEDYLKQFREKDEDLTENLTDALVKARQKGDSAMAVLYAVSVPLLLLVMLFISMISVRIIDSEQSEIVMLHSRGTTRGRIIRIYLVQSLIIAGVAFLPGLLLGYLAGRLAAAATGFLTFSGEAVSGYGIYPGMILVSALAALLAAFVTLAPVFRRSGGTIVENKNRKHVSGIPVWEKFFLDLALLAVSLYLLYDFTKQLDALKLSVLSGEGIDPMIFLTATLFLLSCGLLILRLISYLVRLIFRLGRNRFSSPTYAAFLQIIRTRRGSGVISVFLVLTIAMSVFHANMARTVSANQVERIEYDMGADAVTTEPWKLLVLSSETPKRWRYTEPDYKVYQKLVDEGLAESVTRVIRDDKAVIKAGRGEQETGTLMGIQTKEFGETARLKDGITDEHWFNYLNELSQVTNGMLISRNLAEKYDLKVGDSLTCSRYSPVEEEQIYASSAGKIVGIVDAFPGYDTHEYAYNEEGEMTEKDRYLIVMNYSTVVSSFEKSPYSVWIRSSESGEKLRETLNEWLKPAGRSLDELRSAEEEIRAMQSSSITLITNGLFTLDVLIALMLCVLGYLIYWITSIRDRELLFGIYRAMGISMREVSRMLTLEQLFLSLGPVLAGIGAGSVATVLFAKLFAVVYLPEKHAVELAMHISGGDFLRLGLIIGGVMIACFIIIRQIVRRMKITEALKLGED